MLCTSCGGKLKEAQKFCGGCGSKVQATVPKPGAGSDPVVMIAPLKLELPTMPIEIGNVKIEGPDGDGSFSMIASCKFTNNSKEDWDFLEIRAHLINSDGIVLQESTDTPEELIEASGLYEHEVRFWNVPAAHLGEAEKATVVLSAIASKKHSHEFQDVPIPSTANEINDLAPPCLVGSSLYFTSGSIWKTKPDDDKESRVELNLLLQNTSNTALSKVRLTAEILDKQGKSLTDIGSDKEMRSGELMMLSSGYSNVKDKKLHGAKVKLSVQSYCPAAAAVVQKTGAEVVAADSDSGWGSSSGDEESDVNSDESQEVEIARYIRTDQDGNLVCAIAYTQEVLPAWPENSTRILGAYWGYAGGGVGYDGGFFQIRDDSDPEVLDFQQANQSDQSEKFTSLMSVVSNLYTGEDGTATLSKDGQELIEGGRTEGDCKVYWDSNFQGEDLGKVSQKWDINWRFEWDDINAKDSEEKKNKNNRILVEWSIKRAAINVEEIEDEETKSAINNVIKLCKKKRFEEAVAVLPEINFEFDSGNMDSSPDDYLAESVDSFIVDPSNPNHSIRVGMDGNKLILTIAVIFEMSLVSGVTADDLDEWLSENGGWAAATAAGQWWYLEDDGGSFATIKNISNASANSKNNQNGNTESTAAPKTFEWKMENGEINMNDVEDDVVRAALKSALKLAKAKKFEEAVQALPSMEFEYNFSNLDSDAGEYFAETGGISFQIDPSDPRHIIRLGVSGIKLNLSVCVVFDIPVKSGVDRDELNGWLGDNGGYAAGFASGGWSYNGDEGGYMRIMDAIQNDEPTFVTMEATIKWGHSNDDVNIDNLPTEFIQAKKLWVTKKATNIKKAGDLIAPFIACIFVEGNCDGQLSELFLQSMDEIEADSISVYGLDFSESNLPKVKISARFSNIKSNGLLDKNRLDAWQDDNGYLDSCISFEWRIDGVDEELDLRSWNHEGLSFLLLD